MKPKRNERRLWPATLKTAEVLQAYYILLPLQGGNYCYECADRFDPFLPNQREMGE
jgi:hypothetical protein